MSLYSEPVLGVYPNQKTAQKVKIALLHAGFMSRQVIYLASNDDDFKHAVQFAKLLGQEHRLVMTLAGLSIGGLLGICIVMLQSFAWLQTWLTPSAIEPLVMTAVAALIGSVIGFIVGQRSRQQQRASILRWAEQHQAHGIIVHARSNQEQRQAQRVLQQYTLIN